MTRLQRTILFLSLAALLVPLVLGLAGRAVAEESDEPIVALDSAGTPASQPEINSTEPVEPATPIAETSTPTEIVITPEVTTPTNTVPTSTPVATTSGAALVTPAGAPLPPKIGLSVSSATVGTTIRVQVDYFPPGKRIAIYFDGSRKTTVVTTETGRARGSFTIPVTTGGTHEIKANGGGTFALKSFVVSPELRLSPASLKAGGTLTATLTGFAASNSVKLRLYDLDGTTAVSVWSLTTDPKGSATGSFKTKAATKAGNHTLRASGSGRLSAERLIAITITARTATIDTDILNLRATPDTSGRILAQMLHGETLQIIEQSGEWTKATYHGKTGWAFTTYLAFGGDSASIAVPTHQQQHSLSCEYASLQIATSALGNEIPEDAFIPVVGTANNPHNGFRGNIDGTYIFGTDDYGVYPEPLAEALPQFGFEGEVFYGGISKLKSHLKAGEPVVVWIDLGYNTSFTMIIDGEPVTMAPRSHVVVAYGYSDEGVLISDPDSSTRKRLIPWSDFNVMWNSMDGMALAVSR